MKAILSILFVFAFSALSQNVLREYQDAFESFKIDYSKTYKTQIEEVYRFAVFKQNLDFINSWDSESTGFTVKMNGFGDLTVSEFAAMYNGLLNVTRNGSARLFVYSNEPLDDIVDWRKQGAVTPVKNQGQCGSCWSFSATGSIEGAHFLATKQLVSLSEQNLIDCSVPEGNQGCKGGWMDQAFKYVIQNHGIDTESSYSYTTSGPNSCKFNAANIGATISSYQDIPEGSESGLQAAVAKTPVSVAIDAGHQSFQFYSSGIYYEPACSRTNLDHGVLAVGYGSNGGANGDYWIVKNSWGTGWGMAGYINMSRNRNNNCGIATAASYPIV